MLRSTTFSTPRKRQRQVDQKGLGEYWAHGWSRTSERRQDPRSARLAGTRWLRRHKGIHEVLDASAEGGTSWKLSASG